MSAELDGLVEEQQRLQELLAQKVRHSCCSTASESVTLLTAACVWCGVAQPLHVGFVDSCKLDCSMHMNEVVCTLM
jgi:hypothetical protein